MTTPRDQMVAQLDAALIHYMNLQANREADVMRGTDQVAWSEAGAFCSAAVAAIVNATGRDSTRSVQAQRCVETIEKAAGSAHPLGVAALSRLKGIVDELRSALMAGYLVSFGELIRGDLFADMLEMATYLLDEGYKDAAAVIGGTALEVHLRDLCKKHGIDITAIRGTRTEPKKAATVNDDLMKQGVYTSAEHKQVTAWQGLRNEAAHGNYTVYDKAQVALMIQGVRDFIVKYPA